MRAWLLLGAGLLAAALGLGWTSSALVRLDRSALVGENSRLALWRMDLALARIITAESMRPTADDLPGGKMAAPSSPVVLHFDVGPSGTVTRPRTGVEELLAELRPLLEGGGAAGCHRERQRHHAKRG